MSDTPKHLQDAGEVLGAGGFTTGQTWYHGTSSDLLASILEHGLKRSGDEVMNAATLQTMATIGDRYQPTVEPVFLTPSRELAFYWACQRVRERAIRAGSRANQAASPVVLRVALPPDLNDKVRPDVGAASLLLVPEGEAFMAKLASIYQREGQGVPDIDLRNANRMAYLKTLGMAYLDDDIAPSCIDQVTD